MIFNSFPEVFSVISALIEIRNDETCENCSCRAGGFRCGIRSMLGRRRTDIGHVLESGELLRL